MTDIEEEEEIKSRCELCEEEFEGIGEVCPECEEQDRQGDRTMH